jgi:hypothetical protein
MRKIHVLGLALFAVFAFSAVAAGSASALEELPVWLINNAAVLTLTSVTTTGKLVLTDLKTLIGAVSVECEGTLDGTVGPNGEDETTEVLNKLGEKIGTNLTGVALKDCKNVSNCVEGTIEVWIDNLPFLTQLLLMLIGTEIDILDHAVGKTSEKNLPGYEIRCEIISPKIIATDLCEAKEESGPLLENMPLSPENDVLAIFSNPDNGVSELGECEQGKAESGEITGNVLITTLNPSTELLEVSEVND